MQNGGKNQEKDLHFAQIDSLSTWKDLGFKQKCADYLRRNLCTVLNSNYIQRVRKQNLFKITEVVWNCPDHCVEL